MVGVSEAGGGACVGAVGESDEADREVAEGGHDLWGVAGVEVVTVFVVGDVSDPVEGFDPPVALEPGRDLGGMGLADGEGTQQIHRLGGAGRVALAGASGAGSFHLRDLGETGEGDPGRAVMTLILRWIRRPWPRSLHARGGMFFQGSVFNALRRPGWFLLTIIKSRRVSDGLCKRGWDGLKEIDCG